MDITFYRCLINFPFERQDYHERSRNRIKVIHTKLIKRNDKMEKVFLKSNSSGSESELFSAYDDVISAKCVVDEMYLRYFEAAVLRRRLKQQFLFNCHLGIVVSVKLSSVS